MAFWNRAPKIRRGPQDPRDLVGKNPTGLPRKASAGSRRKAENRLERDLAGTRFEKGKRRGRK